jgi:hypothetical protein
MARLALWLFAVALGLDLGAGLYESRIVVPLWAEGVPDTLASGNPYGRVAVDAGLRFWAYVTSLVALLAAVAFVIGWWAPAPQRSWQLVAAGTELCVVASTLLYFRPTLVRLFIGHGAGLSPDAVVSTVRRWVALSRVRIAFSAVAWLAALHALTLV